jgi:hypothetical protein
MLCQLLKKVLNVRCDNYPGTGGLGQPVKMGFIGRLLSIKLQLLCNFFCSTADNMSFAPCTIIVIEFPHVIIYRI